MEILNHTLVMKDSTQLLGLSNNIECFSSATMGMNKLYLGLEAPAAFRSGATKLTKAKGSEKGLSISSKTGSNTNAIFVATHQQDGKKKLSAFAVGLKGDSLIYFVETSL
jgi:hypothetical protein